MEENHLQHQLQFQVEEKEEGLLREFLLQHKQLSRRSLVQIKQHGELLVNGEPVTVRYGVKRGDQVQVIFPVEKESGYLLPDPGPLDIIYEDRDILLLNKPAGTNVHPTFNQKRDTLANRVMHHRQQKGWQRTFHAVNRLDKNTSGLVLVAQHRFAHQQLSIQQKENCLERRYYAWVEGRVKEEEGIIEAPIARKEGSMIEREVAEKGQYAKTIFTVIQRFQRYTWLELILETGRTHQIRIHLSHIGHPLLGDTLYGGETSWIRRQALHAYATRFRHPTTKKELRFEAPLPQDVAKLVT